MNILSPITIVTPGGPGAEPLNLKESSSASVRFRLDSSGRPDPKLYAEWRDDFMRSGTTSGDIGELRWNLGGTGTATILAGEQGHPGCVRLTTPATSATYVGLYLGDNANFQLDYREIYDMVLAIRVNDTANLGVAFGLTNAASGANIFPPDGVYFCKGTGATIWTGRLLSSNSLSSVNFATQDTSWHYYRFRKDPSSQKAYFSIDGGTEQAIATNHPVVNLNPHISLQTTNATAKSMDVDLVSLAMGTSRY